jgi:hypothetical protein
MSFETPTAFAPDHATVCYPGSSLRFRAPAGDPTQPHVLCIGGTETFGRFIDTPYPGLLADALAMPVVNMGVSGGGLDVLLNDTAIAEAGNVATSIVLQVPGAQTLSNRLYTVHPRRNDRFLRASGILRTVYRDVDFTEFHFVRHMLDHLRALSSDRFSIVRDELRLAWTARMTRLIGDARVPVHLLWLSCRAPWDADRPKELGPDPLFVTEDMLETVARDAASLTIVSAPYFGEEPRRRQQSTIRSRMRANHMFPGSEAHAEAAAALARLLEPE